MKIEISAPGKTILHGEHAVVYGKVNRQMFAFALKLRVNLIFIVFH